MEQEKRERAAAALEVQERETEENTLEKVLDM